MATKANTGVFVYNITWDIEEEDITQSLTELPSAIYLENHNPEDDDEIGLLEDINNHLSDTYGWLVTGYEYTVLHDDW